MKGLKESISSYEKKKILILISIDFFSLINAWQIKKEKLAVFLNRFLYKKTYVYYRIAKGCVYGGDYTRHCLSLVFSLLFFHSLLSYRPLFSIFVFRGHCYQRSPSCLPLVHSHACQLRHTETHRRKRSDHRSSLFYVIR